MPTNTSRSSYDTYTAEAFATQNFGNRSQLKLSAGTGHHRYGYVYFAGMPPPGATVLSATLSLWLRSTGWSGGPHTISVKRVNDKWSESKLTWKSSGSDQQAGTQVWGTAAVTNGTDGQQVDIDLTSLFAAIAAGTYDYYGLRLEVDTGDNVIRALYSSESIFHDQRPQLSIVYSRPPDAPSDLAPQGDTAVSLALPTLKWVFKDPDGDEQAQYQVQICTDNNFSTNEFDSGWVASVSHQIDLSGTTYTGVPEGSERYWRVRVKDVNGLTSDWSTPAGFMRTPKGTLAISNPPNGGFVEETTPPITTTLSGRSQDTIAYVLKEQQANGSYKQVWSSGRFTAIAADGTAFSFNIPSGYIKGNGTNYQLTVWSYDTVDREATPGDPVYVTAQSVFTFQRSSVPSPVGDLAVTSDGPGTQITWNRATQPDYFALRVDGRLVFDRMDPAPLLLTAANLLTGDASEFATSTGGWTGAGNSTIAQTLSRGFNGTGALQLTATTAANMNAASCVASKITTNGLPCTPGDTVNLHAQFRAATTGRSCNINAQFYDASGTQISILGGANVTDDTLDWQEATATVTAPANAAFYRVFATVVSPAAGEVHYIDSVWADNGSSGYGMVHYNETPNTEHTYEIEAVVEDSGKLKHSQNNATVTTTAFVSYIWLVDNSEPPYAVGQNVDIVRITGQDQQDLSIGESSQTFYPIGRQDPVYIADSIRGLEGTITGTILDDENGYADVLRGMKNPTKVGKTYRLIYGRTSIPVQLGAVSISEISSAAVPQWAVSIAVAQVGGF